MKPTHKGKRKMTPRIRKDGLHRAFATLSIEPPFLDMISLALHPLYETVEKGFTLRQASNIDANAVSDTLSFITGKNNDVVVLRIETMKEEAFLNDVNRRLLHFFDGMGSVLLTAEFQSKLEGDELDWENPTDVKIISLIEKFISKPVSRKADKKIDEVADEAFHELADGYISTVYESGILQTIKAMAGFAKQKNGEDLAKCAKIIDLLASHIIVGLSHEEKKWILIAP